MENLLLFTKEKYGENYDSHLIEMFKLYVDSAEKNSDRRQKANSYLLSINTAFIALLGAFSIKDVNTLIWQISLSLSLIGVSISVLWSVILKTYKRLNSAKFKVINSIAEHLPISHYSAECDILKTQNYKSLSNLEQVVPFIFTGVYIFFFFFCFSIIICVLPFFLLIQTLWYP
jgi:Na+/H+-dicarboxylate symporter